jgi:hypothetical protein
MSYIHHTRSPASFNDIQALTPAKAREEIERRRQAAMDLMEFYREELTAHGLPPNRQLDTLADVFVYLAGKLHLEQVAPPDDLPKWLEDTKSKPFWDFDAASVPTVVALGFYLGNTLVENFEHLEWRIGTQRMVYFGQPVVSARARVKFWAEDPVMMVASVSLRQFLQQGDPRSSIADPISRHIEYAQKSLSSWMGMTHPK